MTLNARWLTEGLYRLCHQRQAADALHAPEHALLPVPHVEVCGVAALRVLHHDHDSPEHRGAHDEGTPHVHTRPLKLRLKTKTHRLFNHA